MMDVKMNTKKFLISKKNSDLAIFSENSECLEYVFLNENLYLAVVILEILRLRRVLNMIIVSINPI